jgi:predicted NBD/HSP70 family sugar kinase
VSTTPQAEPRRVDPGRQANLSGLLRRVHAARTTRSELTRQSGLNRSTVAALIAELADRGLVVESGADGEGRVGRPSVAVQPADRAVALAVHLEIDAVRVAAVLLGGRVVDRLTFRVERPTPDQVLELVQRGSTEISSRLPALSRLVGVGVAVPGLVRASDGFVRFAPHLGWRDVPLAASLEDVLGVEVFAANDASLGAAAEWEFGAGRGSQNLLYVNGGASGIGGGIVAGGGPLRGATGHAGEIGHVTVATGTEVVDSAGLVGTLEALVSRKRLTDALGIPMPDPDALERALVESTSADVFAEMDHQIDALGIALGSVVNVLGSDRVVLGGFLSALAAARGDALRSAVASRLIDPLISEITIRRAELGADLLLIGAASLPIERVLADLPDLG